MGFNISPVVFDFLTFVKIHTKHRCPWGYKSWCDLSATGEAVQFLGEKEEQSSCLWVQCREQCPRLIEL
jgi:hypothetical protein